MSIEFGSGFNFDKLIEKIKGDGHKKKNDDTLEAVRRRKAIKPGLPPTATWKEIYDADSKRRYKGKK
jgi:hypothetical protein